MTVGQTEFECSLECSSIDRHQIILFSFSINFKKPYSNLKRDKKCPLKSAMSRMAGTNFKLKETEKHYNHFREP